MQSRMWDVAELAVLMVAMTVALWLTATDFDATEVKSIVMVFVIAATGKGATRLLGRH